MMLNKLSYRILNACADDWEVFYFIFAQVNYGGQVFSRGEGSGFAQYEDEHPWSVHVPSENLIKEIVELVKGGFLQVREVGPGNARTLLKPESVGLDSLSAYRNYSCLTFDQHEREFGYGPHEFTASARGAEEIKAPHYREYDRELGWG